MITKTGNSLVKEALLPGAITGAIRASNLTPEERKALEKEYDLPEGANLGWRNAGRGAVGGAVGQAIGGLTSKLLGGRFKIPLYLGGYATGIKLMTDKYGGGRAKDIMERNNKPDA